MKLVELLVSIAVFVGISFAIYLGFQNVMDIVILSKSKTIAISLINEKFEIMRNMPYENIGLVNGIPAGTIDRFQTIERSDLTFGATTTIRNVDDPFDGTIGGTPNDLSPADYKSVTIEISCISCKRKFENSLTTVIAPNGLETSSGNGALFIKVFDSSGQPIQGANVKIINSNLSPTINIEEVTDINGMVAIVDAPPSQEDYEIEVSKIGYSKERTYAYGDVDNPNPIKPHATVVLQQITQSSFSIDRTGVINVSILNDSCQAVSGESFSISGSKLIGNNPSVFAFATTSYYVNSSGNKTLSDMAWDTYNIVFDSNDYFLSGTIPILPINLSPQSVVDVGLVVKNKNRGALLVTVLDNSTNMPISGAGVEVSSGSFDDTKTTGQGVRFDNNWNENNISDGNIYIDEIQKTLSLNQIAGSYVPNGEIISSTFDLGTSSDIYNVFWSPESQAQGVGDEAVKVQIAGNNDNSTWNFVGPDGTNSTYYTVSGQSVYFMNNYRYIKYRLILSTENISVSPVISNISFSYSSFCSPPGQTYFDDLSSGTYNINVQKSGYNNNSTQYFLNNNGYGHVKINLNQ